MKETAGKVTKRSCVAKMFCNILKLTLLKALFAREADPLDRSGDIYRIVYNPSFSLKKRTDEKTKKRTRKAILKNMAH